MASPRLAKRSKTNDTPSSVNPVVVPDIASSSEPKDSVPANNTVINVKDVLFSLATSKTQAQAIKAMTMLDDSMLMGTNAQQVLDLQGVSTIVYSILRYQRSETMLQGGLGALVNMIYALPTDKVGEALQRLDFLEKIPSLVSIHNTYLASSYAAGLLGNLALDTKNRESLLQLGSEEIVKFMVTTMATYPDDDYVTDSACDYLVSISRFPEVKERLLKQGVFARMAAAFQLFSTFDGALEFDEGDTPRVKRIIKHSQQVMVRLIDL
jgi:hypothetical protein